MTELPYRPIACDVHDRLLAAATLRRETDLEVGLPGATPEHIRAVIVDVYSREGAEYLLLADGRTIRLDAIRSLDGGPVRPSGAGGAR